MYTVVLMAALSTTPSTQAWHRARCNGCSGCHGSHGYVAANTGWYGGGCYGCYGYGHPWQASSGVSGSFGTFDGGFYPGVYQCHGCYGCYAGWSCWGYPTGHAPVESAPPSGVPDRKVQKMPRAGVEEAPLPKTPGAKNDEQARAKVIVDLPADAKLFVDGQRMNGNASRRVFQTPSLIPGQVYYYELRAEIVRDGQTIIANQRVILRPGENATASFADLGQRREATARATGN